MEDFYELGFQVALPIVLLFLGWIVGRKREARHYRDINAREVAFRSIPVTSTKTLPDDRPIKESKLVYGSVVIAVDYFKVFTSGFRKLVGGEMRAYAPLLDRARREAVLRAMESTPDADLFLNLRVDTSKISGSAQKMGAVEAIAHVTAIRYEV